MTTVAVVSQLSPQNACFPGFFLLLFMPRLIPQVSVVASVFGGLQKLATIDATLAELQKGQMQLEMGQQRLETRLELLIRDLNSERVDAATLRS